MPTVIELVLFGAVLVSAVWVVGLGFRRLSAVDRAERAGLREAERAQARVAAALAAPGALPEAPIRVRSAAAIEPRAESQPCPICGGRLHVDEHAASAPARSRRLRMRCGDCGRHSELFFEIASDAPN